MPLLPWIQTLFLALTLTPAVKTVTLAGKCKKSLLLVLQEESHLCIFLLACTTMNGAGGDASIDHSFPSCNKRKRTFRDRRTWEQALYNCTA